MPEDPGQIDCATLVRVVRTSCGAQVMNNRIESYAPGMIVGANVDASVPFRYPDIGNVAFIGNKVINVQYSPLTITSGGSMKVQGNSFQNVMCSAATTNTRLFSWQLPFTPIQVWGVPAQNRLSSGICCLMQIACMQMMHIPVLGSRYQGSYPLVPAAS